MYNSHFHTHVLSLVQNLGFKKAVINKAYFSNNVEKIRLEN